MSWDYRIFALPAAHALKSFHALNGNIGDYTAQTPIAPFKPIHDWLTSHADQWSPRGHDTLAIQIGSEGYIVLKLHTARGDAMLDDALRAREESRDNSSDFIDRAMSSYIPADDEPVVEISIEGRGTGDTVIIGHLLAHLHAVAFDCQTCDILTAEQWLKPPFPGFSVPWHAILRPPSSCRSPLDPAFGLAAELARETGPHHPLFSIPVMAVATRQDCDDVLFQLLDGSGRFAAVHLTYGNRPEPDPRWPETELFDSLEAFALLRMHPDSADWNDF